jgi:hypothetical protein
MPVTRFAIEDLLDGVEQILKDNLAAKVSEINTERASDGYAITLDAIDSAAFFKQTLDDSITNYPVFVFTGISDLGESQVDEYGRTTVPVEIFALVIRATEGNETGSWRRDFRYQRALLEVIEESFDKAGNGLKLSVSSLTPTDLKLLESPQNHRALGVLLRATLG